MGEDVRLRHVLGIDAGGSHTRCQIANEDGHIAALGYGGPANTNFVSSRSAQSAVTRAVSSALKSFGRPIEAVVIAGPHLPPAVAALVSELVGTEDITFVDEFEACLAAGLRRAARRSVREPGVVIMSGTGSFCRGRNAMGEEQYVGGWGPLIGDEGSGYDLGQEALRAVVRAHDGRGKETLLMELLLTQLKLDEVQDLKKCLYKPPVRRHRIAGLARHVFEAAAVGDEVAEEILQNGGMRLADLSRPVLEGLFDSGEVFPVVLSGGILRERSLLTDRLMGEIETVRPRAEPFISPLQPVSGTVIIGLDSIGVRIDSTTVGNLLKATGE